MTDAESLQFSGSTCIIAENKMTFLTLPPVRGGIGIHGSGYGAELLGRLSWLHDCRILYWGDIDAHGFQILSNLRAVLPHVRSVMMDGQTLDDHRGFVVEGSPLDAELPRLTAGEKALYSIVRSENLRLEQEKISHSYAVWRFSDVLREV